MKSMRPIGPPSASDQPSVRLPRKSFVHEILDSSVHSNQPPTAGDLHLPPTGNTTSFKKDGVADSMVDSSLKDRGSPTKLANEEVSLGGGQNLRDFGNAINANQSFAAAGFNVIGSITSQPLVRPQAQIALPKLSASGVSEQAVLPEANAVPATASAIGSSATQSENPTQPLLGADSTVVGLPNTSLDTLVQRVVSTTTEGESGFEASFATLQQPQGIEEQVVTPVGLTQQFLESRVYGVHLLPSAYLSEVGLAIDVPQEAGEMYAMGAPVLHAAQRSSDVHVDVSEWTDVDAAQERASNASLNLFSEIEFTDEIVAPSATNRSMASTLASAISWPESLLRLTKNHDGSLVVWLRDFRMSSSSARPVIASLVAQAKAQNVVLGRIVVNGREAWTSTSKGDDHVR